MNVEQLLAHFDCINDVPDAIPHLRQFIIELAVRGRLIDSISIDDSVPELLNHIQSEMERRITEGSIKEKKPLRPVQSDEVWFEVPKNWCWVRLGMIAQILMGQSPPGDTYNRTGDGIPLINGPVEFTDGPFSETIVNQYTTAPTNICEKGDLLLCVRGSTTGRTNVAGYRACIGRGVAAIRPFLNDQYVRLFICRLRKNIIAMGRGIAFPSISRQQIEELPIPLPPLGEQQHIVAKVDELMALCDQLEAAQTKRESRRDRLVVAALQRLDQPAADAHAFRKNASFYMNLLPRITTRPEHIRQIRQTILNLAVRGKLVEQEPDDEPAFDLLKRIQKEKEQLIKADDIKMANSSPAIVNQCSLFELPHGWSWVRLGDLAKLVTSGSRDWAKYYSTDGALFVRMGNLSRDSYKLRLDNIQRVTPPVDGEGARTRLEEGDILISITGEVGLLGLIPPNFGEAYINQHTCLVRLMDLLKNRYFPELFRSPFAQRQFNEPQRGIKNSFRLTDVTEMIVPLPPITEQHRIVAKVDELMALCDRLEIQLTTINTDIRRLLESMLKDVLDMPATSNDFLEAR